MYSHCKLLNLMDIYENILLHFIIISESPIQICVLELHQVWEAPKLEAKITVHHFREKVLDFHKILKMACHPKG